MEKEILKRIENFSTKELAAIWCSLNSWEFPESIKEFKPDWWDTSRNARSDTEVASKYNFSSPIMGYIKSKIGEKEKFIQKS